MAIPIFVGYGEATLLGWQPSGEKRSRASVRGHVRSMLGYPSKWRKTTSSATLKWENLMEPGFLAILTQ